MGEIPVAQVVTSLENILKDILHVSEESGRNTLTADFIKCLPASGDIFLDAGVAFSRERPCHITCIGYPEPVMPLVGSHLPGITIGNRRTLQITIFSDDFKHGGFACPDVSPQP